MPTTIGARIRRGFGGQSLAQLSVFCFQFASVPLLLHYWGVQLYGEWLVLFALPAWLMLSDLGVTTATTNDMTMRVAAGDYARAKATFQTSWLVLTGISLLAALVAFAGAALLPLASMFGFVILDPMTTLLVLALLLLQALVSLQANLLASGLVSSGAYGEASAVDGATRLVGFALMAAAVAGGFGPVGAAAALACGSITGFGVLRWRVRRRSDWFAYGVGAASMAAGKRLLAPSAGFTGFVLGNALSIQGPILLIGAVIGPSATATYSTLRMLTRAVVTLSTMLFATIRPEIAIAHGSGDIAMVRRLHMRAVQGAVWLVGPAVIALLLAGDPIVRYWTGGKIAVVEPLFWLLIADMAVYVIASASGTVLYATNRSYVVAPVFVGAAAIGLGLGAILADNLGLAGIALGAVATEVAVVAWVLFRTLPSVGERFIPFALRVARPPLDAWRPFLRR